MTIAHYVCGTSRWFVGKLLDFNFSSELSLLSTVERIDRIDPWKYSIIGPGVAQEADRVDKKDPQAFKETMYQKHHSQRGSENKPQEELYLVPSQYDVNTCKSLKSRTEANRTLSSTLSPPLPSHPGHPSIHPFHALPYAITDISRLCSYLGIEGKKSSSSSYFPSSTGAHKQW